MLVLDTTALSFLFIPGYTPSYPIKYGKERLEALIDKVASEHDKIGIPTPALSEFLVTCDEKRTDEFLKMLRSSQWFEILDFDSAAAVEVGMRTRKAIEAGDKKEGMTTSNTKIKFDRQIVGIAIATGAKSIVSDDPDVKSLGVRWGIEVIRVQDLPIPPHLVPPPIIAMAMEADERAKKKAEAESAKSSDIVTDKPAQEVRTGRSRRKPRPK
jgi:predicted nucleic acid-binding protein